MIQLLCILCVTIVLLCKVSETKGEPTRAFLTNSTFSWSDAIGKCRLIQNETTIPYSQSPTGLGWTNISAEYLPWVEYLGCFKMWEGKGLNAIQKHVTDGEQLKECILRCEEYQFLGLQKSLCICLRNFTLTEEFIETHCDRNVTTCSGDRFAFCGKEDGNGYLSVYKKVNVDDTYGNIGNCLFVNTSNSNDFKAKECSTKFHHICLNSNETGFNLQSTTKSNWKDAFGYCKNLASYNLVRGKINTINVLESFWLSNTRRWTRKREFLDAAEDPEFCVAAKIRQNGDVKRFIHRCGQRLPGLCIEVGKTVSDTPSKMSSTLSPGNTFSRRLDKTSSFLRSNTCQGITISTYSASQKSTFLSQLGSTSPALKETTGRSKMVPETTSPSRDIQENTFPVLVESPSSDVPGKNEIDVVSEIVIIAIVAATILIVIVISVTVVFCKRRTSLRSERRPTFVSRNKVAYENAPNDLSRNHTADNTIEHMHYQSLNQNRNTVGSNYDILHSDEVDVTRDRQTKSVIGETAEYRQVEADDQEIQDVSI